MADFKSVLQVRVAADGTRRIVGDPPDRHVFPARWVGRELGRLAKVTVTVTTDAGDVTYQLDGFDVTADGQPNLSGWVCQKVEG